jgi:hypothetical protein
MSSTVKDHSSLYHTNHCSVGAERTPFPWALGMQYFLTAMVLFPGIPATAMHVSLLMGLALLLFFEPVLAVMS